MFETLPTIGKAFALEICCGLPKGGNALLPTAIGPITKLILELSIWSSNVAGFKFSGINSGMLMTETLAETRALYKTYYGLLLNDNYTTPMIPESLQNLTLMEARVIKASAYLRYEFRFR